MPKPRRRTRPESIKHCPQCNSIRLVYEAGLVTGQVYHCLDCNYVGSFVIEFDAPADPDPADDAGA